MKYLLKTLAKNNREMRTSLLYTTRHHGQANNSRIIISAPEGMQRMIKTQKIRASRDMELVLLPSLGA